MHRAHQHLKTTEGVSLKPRSCSKNSLLMESKNFSPMKSPEKLMAAVHNNYQGRPHISVVSDYREYVKLTEQRKASYQEKGLLESKEQSKFVGSFVKDSL
jgi:hypothetical protein